MESARQKVIHNAYSIKKPKNKYQTFYQMWKKAHPDQKGIEVQAQVNDYWRENKHDISRIDAAIKSWTEKQPIENSKVGLSKLDASPIHFQMAEPTKMRSKSTPTRMKRKSSVDEQEHDDIDPSSERRETPAQRKICLQLSACKQKMDLLNMSIEESTVSDERQLDLLQELRQESFELERQLKRLKDCAKRNRKCRERKKMRGAVASLTTTTTTASAPSSPTPRVSDSPVCDDNRPQANDVTHVSEAIDSVLACSKKGRRTRNGKNRNRNADVRGPEWQLLQTLVNLVTLLANIDEKRAEALRACRTLDELHLELKLHGFQINRTAPYLRLLPMYWSTYDGKRHKKTVPVVVRRRHHQYGPDNQPPTNSTVVATNDDHHFIRATNTFLQELVELYGPQVCFVLSHDSKVSVPLRLSSDHQHAPLLMRLEYRSTPLQGNVTSLDAGHALSPSVYAGISFDSTGNLNAAGPTYVAIHSGGRQQHNPLTAHIHSQHFRQLVKSSAFSSLSLDRGGELKPVVVMYVDDTAATGPRLPETLRQSASIFQDHDLDALFVACHARTETICGAVEQRVAALSDDVSGIVLPRDYLHATGSAGQPHLDQDSFRRVGQCLADVWSECQLDGYTVDARYVDQLSDGATQQRRMSADRSEQLSESWKATHVRQSSYLLQIVKCGSPACCKPFRTNLHCYLPRGFLPPPLLVKRTERGVILCNKSRSAVAETTNGGDGFFTDLFQRLTLQHLEPDMMPFDYFCPSSASRLLERTCETCRLYLPSRTACRAHQKVHSQVIQKYVYSIRQKLQQFVVAGEVAPTNMSSLNEPSSSPEDSVDDESSSPSVGIDGDSGADVILVVSDARSWLEPAFQEIH